METNNQELIATSLIKAVVYAAILPFVIMVIGSVMYDIATAVHTVSVWYILFILVYKFSTNKQLTAYYFFSVLKYFVLPIVGGYAALVTFFYIVARFF